MLMKNVVAVVWFFLQDIIGRFPDLLDGFNRFLQRCETMDAVDSEMRSQFGAGKISAKDMARLKGQTVRSAAWWATGHAGSP
jgi:hypothetical protein